MDPYDTLLAAFRALDPGERENLAYHAAAGTPVLVGEEAMWYSTESGAG